MPTRMTVKFANESYFELLARGRPVNAGVDPMEAQRATVKPGSRAWYNDVNSGKTPKEQLPGYTKYFRTLRA
jgi:hypothetical protein